MSSDSCGGKEKSPKGLILRRVGYLSLQEAINEHYEKGYKVRSVYPNFESYEAEKGSSIWYAFIELDTGGYEDVTMVADAPEETANVLLAKKEGWEIASTSVSSKFYRMVKREKEKC